MTWRCWECMWPQKVDLVEADDHGEAAAHYARLLWSSGDEAESYRVTVESPAGRRWVMRAHAVRLTVFEAEEIAEGVASCRN